MKDKEIRLVTAKINLTSTDWVIVKMIECTDDTEREAMRVKYADIIAQRKLWREEINELEK